MTATRRAFDLVLAALLSALLAPLILGLALLSLALQGRPVFFLSERMRAPDRGFRLVKFRTMAPDSADGGVSGGDKAARITPFGAVLRRSRLDELPQLWNILRGDMAFVGPRPPLRRYVEQFPDLYARVLQDRPGVTGLATLVFHRHEERILARCRSAAETEAAYVRRCVPRKARIDLIHQARRGPCLDLAILARTLGASVRRLPLQRGGRGRAPRAGPLAPDRWLNIP
ncbi:MAG: sugar transferase [Defluviimonas sp.]|nr:sugar transferase [Defluviimonas sp.]